MTQEEAETMAKTAYTIFRGADVSDDTQTHWDDLTVAQRAPLIFVAKFAFTYPR